MYVVVCNIEERNWTYTTVMWHAFRSIHVRNTINIHCILEMPQRHRCISKIEAAAAAAAIAIALDFENTWLPISQSTDAIK